MPMTIQVVEVQKIFDDKSIYSAFPGIIRTKSEIVVPFSSQAIDELTSSGLHPHYYPVSEEKYAVSKDNGKSWEITNESPQTGNVLHATRRAHYAVGAMANGDVCTFFSGYKHGTTSTLPESLQIHHKRIWDKPIWQKDISSFCKEDKIFPFSMTRLKDDSFIACGYCSVSKPSAEPTHEMKVMSISKDGHDIEMLSTIENDNPFLFSECEAIECSDGRLLMMLRVDWDLSKVSPETDTEEVNGNGKKRDGYGYYLYQSESLDKGKTWSKPAKTGIWGHPANLLRLKSGNLLMVFGARRPPYSICAILSHDDGRTWDMASMANVYTFQPGNYDMGYPVATQMVDGRILCVFYGYSSENLETNSPHAIYSGLLKEQ